MPILKKNKTRKNKTGKNKTRKNKLTKGGEYVIDEPKESMKQLEGYSSKPTYDIIHKDYKEPKKDGKNQCVPQQANNSKKVDTSHNYCEIDDLIASVLGRLLETPVYSKDKTLADDSSSKNNKFSFLTNLSHIPLSFFEFKTKTSGKQSATKKMYLTVEKIKKTLEDIRTERLNVYAKTHQVIDPKYVKEGYTFNIYEYKFFPTKINITAPVAPVATQPIPNPKIEVSNLTKGGGKEPHGFHLPPLKPKDLNIIIEKNFKIMDDNWIKNHKDYNAIIDGLNLMGGGGDSGISTLKENLEKIFKKTTILKKILVVYRGAIQHSLHRLNIENTINNIITSMVHKDVTIDVMYVHTSITDNTSISKIQSPRVQSPIKPKFQPQNIFPPPPQNIFPPPPQNILLDDFGNIIYNNNGQLIYYNPNFNPNFYDYSYPLSGKQKYLVDMLQLTRNQQQFQQQQQQFQQQPLYYTGGLKTKKTKKNKKVRKHKGIVQTGGKKGKLRKGYRYSGKKLKSGLPQIIKCKSKK